MVRLVAGVEARVTHVAVAHVEYWKPLPGDAMAMRAYLYVDGESHFRRSAACLDKLWPGATLDKIQPEERGSGQLAPFRQPGSSNLGVYPDAQFFWDGYIVLRCYAPL